MVQARVVVVEDDPTNRIMITQILKKSDFEVYASSNGRLGLDLIHEMKPDVVVTDIQMPEMDGVAMLQALREDARTSALPVLMLTSLDERATVRSTMALGADDYLTKPFTPEELVAAVQTQLTKRKRLSDVRDRAIATAVSAAMDSQRHNLAGIYERRLKQELSAGLWGNERKTDDNRSFELATLLFVDLVGPLWREQLNPAELAEALKLAHSGASDALGLFGAHNINMVGEALLAVFIPNNDTHSVNHATRALKSALAVHKSAARVKAHLQQKHPAGNFSEFGVGVAVHSGPVAIAQLGDSGVPVGESVKAVMLLHKRYTNTRRPVVATQASVELMQRQALVGASAEVALFGDGKVHVVHEILGVRN